jgi:hypothetical protein
MDDSWKLAREKEIIAKQKNARSYSQTTERLQQQRHRGAQVIEK